MGNVQGLPEEYQRDEHLPSPHEYEYLQDLVPFAVEVRALLACVDTAPLLGRPFDESFYTRCLERYLNQWLPLVDAATHQPSDTQVLAPPLDCAWIWYVHMLDPVAYKKYCKMKFGRVLRRPRPLRTKCNVLMPTVKAYLATEVLWRHEYPNEPFEVVGTLPHVMDRTTVQRPVYLCLEWQPRMPFKSAAVGKKKDDILGACQRQLENFVYQVQLEHYGDSRFLGAALQRYYAFLKLKQENPKSFLAPTYDMDLIWHTHMAFPTRYAQDIKHLLGRTLPHDDSVIDRSAGSKLDKAFRLTKRLWEAKYPKSNYAKRGCMWRGNAPGLLSFDIKADLKGTLKDANKKTQEGYRFEEPYRFVAETGAAFYGSIDTVTGEIQLRDRNHRIVCASRRPRPGELPHSEECSIVIYDGADWALIKSKWTGTVVGIPGVRHDSEKRTNGIRGVQGKPGKLKATWSPLSGAVHLPKHSDRVKVVLLGPAVASCPKSKLRLMSGNRCVLELDLASGSVTLQGLEPMSIPPMLVTAMELSRLHHLCRALKFASCFDKLTAEEKIRSKALMKWIRTDLTDLPGFVLVSAAELAMIHHGPGGCGSDGCGGCGGCGACGGCGGCGAGDGGGCGSGACGGGGGGGACGGGGGGGC